MPKTHPWFIKGRSDTIAEFEAFKYTLPNTIVLTNNHVNCQVCKKLGVTKTSKHQMQQTYLACSSKSCLSKPMVVGLCPAKLKVETCSLTKKVILYQLYEHLDNEATYVPEESRGIDKKVKKLIEKIIQKKDISQPKEIEIELSKKRYKKKLFGKAIPTSMQLRNYLAYRRRRLGINLLVILNFEVKAN